MADGGSDHRSQRLIVLYGSQTGTAQDLGEELARKGRRRGFSPVELQAWDDYDVTRLPEETLLLAVVSTTGDGEEPDNMRKSWRFLLRKALPAGSLGRLRFGTFGLGDSTYPKFNAVARRLHTRLKQLGAKPLVEIGLGDDQSPRGVLGDFDTWCQSMWPALHALCPGVLLPPDVNRPALEPLIYDCQVVEICTGGAGDDVGDAAALGHRAAPNYPNAQEGEEEDLDDLPAFYQRPYGARNPGPRPFPARLLVNKRLTPDDWFQETRHLEFDLGGFLEGAGQGRDEDKCGGPQGTRQERQPYQAGDVAYLYPENRPNAVSAFLRLCNLHPQTILRIRHHPEGKALTDLTGPGDVPSECRAATLFRRYLDINAVPKRAVLEQLALLAENPEERDKLLELSSPEGADLYHEYCYREKRSVGEVLQDFPSVRPSLSRLLSLLPRLRPRAFSIASSSHPLGPSPNQLHLCVAVVAFRTPYKRHRQGLCSSYLASLSPGKRVPLWIRPGSFLLPPDPRTPLIMVGPGTGVAPFKAMVEERAAQRKAMASAANGRHDVGGKANVEGEGSVVSNRPPPYEWLFYGCRKEKVDFYYREELEGYTREGKGGEEEGRGEGGLVLVTAFSRDRADGSKLYVTHRLQEEGPRLWPLLAGEGGPGLDPVTNKELASFFVAGSAKRMPTDVLNTLKGVAATEGRLEGKEAGQFLDGLVRARRYCVESWSV